MEVDHVRLTVRQTCQRCLDGLHLDGRVGVRGINDVQEQVDVLRKREISWSRIGDALGISRQAAWERFA